MPQQKQLPGLPVPAEKVEDMKFDLPKSEPIKGYPELRWQGKRPFTSTQYFPAQLKERYGDPLDGWMNRIYWGDNLQVMSHLLKEFRGKVDLVYIDPPFDSKADYKKTISIRGANFTNDKSTFEEKQYADIWNNDEYLQHIYERFILIREILSDRGSIFVHVDWHKSHFVRVILDEIFGAKNFVNEIIWKSQSPSGMKAMANKFSYCHENIYWYSKTDDKIYNKQYTDYSEDYIKSKFRKDADGRLWKDAELQSPSSETLGRLKAEGRLIETSSGKLRVKQYLHDLPGVLIDSVWLGTAAVNSQAQERLGYPTQKPEAILERILLASSSPGSIVFDCFMGSGTTQAVAMKLGRRFIGADINLGAIQTTTKRLNGILAEKKTERKRLLDDEHPLYLNFEVYNVNHYDVFRNPVQAKDLLIQILEIDPMESTDLFDGVKDGYLVKIMPVNRIATRADLNPIITGISYRELDRSIEQAPNRPAARIMLVCMGHEPDLAATLKMEIGTQYNIDVEVVDILRDKQDLTFKYDSEADIAIENGELAIRQFYPRNLLQKLSILEENVDEWRELAETVAIDWNYNGEVLRPAVYDNPGKNELVKGRYKLPGDYGQIRVKITDVLSESLEITVEGGQ